MTVENLVGLLIAVAVGGYVLYALLRPEKF
jgi:K+-transporting ATPase KdpF subunit